MLALFGIAVAVISGTIVAALQRSPISAQEQSKTEQLGGHTPGYPIVKTTGDVLDPTSLPIEPKNAPLDPAKYLREFNYGRISKAPNGTTIREFTLIASDQDTKEISPGVFYNVWTFNGTVPAPTLRATEGDLIRINFINNGTHFHTLHFHGIHPAEMDGVFEGIAPGGKFTYEFTAEPFGLFPYHCHIQPLEEHISHGLYGALIIDPKEPRPKADEMVMIMNGFDTDFDAENNFYAVNTIPYYYMHHPIQIEKNKPIRIYLLNMLEFDPLNNFHLHANMFYFYPSGTLRTPTDYSDIATLNQGERGIMEFTYKYPGKYMFHAHKTEFAEKGWMGTFLVKDSVDEQTKTNANSNDNNLSSPSSPDYLRQVSNDTIDPKPTGGIR
ncbi:MAG TPA: multicopper oxidase domain-containing protein [Nitrososphaeraceae archaeon]